MKFSAATAVVMAIASLAHAQDQEESSSCKCGNGKAKIWGPGGPHTALIPVADLFNAAQNESRAEIEICYGPEGNWREDALECASGLMTAAEQQTAGFLRNYESILARATANESNATEFLASGSMPQPQPATPITMHKATLVVLNGNPKNISSLEDILNRDDVGVVVNDGNMYGTLTSGTAVWEDVVGRTGKLADLSNIRDKICFVAAGSGAARDQLLDESNGCDVWISWHDWAVANEDKFDEIDLPSDQVIYRDLNIIPVAATRGEEDGGGSPSVVDDFITFALENAEAEMAMEAAGWFKEF